MNDNHRDERHGGFTRRDNSRAAIAGARVTEERGSLPGGNGLPHEPRSKDGWEKPAPE